MKTLKVTCKNCSQQFRGNYCNNCGQPANTSRIDLKYFSINIQLVFLSFDKGALFTIKELFTRPGHSIRDFIEGKRIKYFRPVSLLILLATLYTLISKNIEIPLIVKSTNNIADSESQKILAGKITQFIKIMIHNYGIFYCCSSL